jgi:hypothetical protein
MNLGRFDKPLTALALAGAVVALAACASNGGGGSTKSASGPANSAAPTNTAPQ